ncbi:insulinase family protein [Candidatus Dojkabacteria bacterium]|nr:insulinase family protein [Candidatus Dojkabacteria bacterium]
MDRRLIDTWTDERYESTSNVFKLTNGLTVVESVKPEIKTIDVSIIFRGGSFFEKQAKVPNGTAHLLEHIIAGKPNKRHKTLEALDRSTLGTLKAPSLVINARTSFINLYLYGSTHQKGSLKLLRNLRYRLDYPHENIEKYVTKEKEVVLSEIATSKEKKDVGIKLNKFLIGNEYPEVTIPIGGTSKDIPKITAAHLIRFKDMIYNPKNVVVTVQYGRRLSKGLWDEIYKIAELFTNNKISFKSENRPVKNEFSVYHFKDDLYRNDVYVAVSYLNKRPVKIDYKKSVLWSLFYSLFQEVERIFIREGKGYIYWGSYINHYLIWNINSKGYKFSCRLEKLGDVMDDVFNVLTCKINEFLDSSYGKRWFIDQLSWFLFKDNWKYESEYAENIGINILNGSDYKFSRDKKEAVLKKLEVSELKLFIKDQFLNTAPRLWLSSPFEKSRVLRVLKKTRFYKYFSKIKPKVI